jgi:hypothetical protein
MKRSIHIILLFGFITLLFLSSACNSQNRKRGNTKKDADVTYPSKASMYDLAEDYVRQLKSGPADTIILYKRTCINCCDFFNIFWISNGQQNLTKFYFDFDDLLIHSKKSQLTNNKVFKMLHEQYSELKSTAIKDNVHKNKDGSLTMQLIDHYCYTEMSIYTRYDSIITNRMKDHDFAEYADYESPSASNKEKRKTNDNYLENIQSKWNLWLTTIEDEIANMPTSLLREKETLRTRN